MRGDEGFAMISFLVSVTIFACNIQQQKNRRLEKKQQRLLECWNVNSLIKMFADEYITLIIVTVLYITFKTKNSAIAKKADRIAYVRSPASDFHHSHGEKAICQRWDSFKHSIL